MHAVEGPALSTRMQVNLRDVSGHLALESRGHPLSLLHHVGSLAGRGAGGACVWRVSCLAGRHTDPQWAWDLQGMSAELAQLGCRGFHDAATIANVRRTDDDQNSAETLSSIRLTLSLSFLHRGCNTCSTAMACCPNFALETAACGCRTALWTAPAGSPSGSRARWPFRSLAQACRR